MVVLLNKGQRTWDLKPGVGKDDKPVVRKLAPGGTIEALDEAEAKHMLGYHEIVDAEKAMPVVADKLKALSDEVAQLKALNADLAAKWALYEPEEGDDKGKDKGKGKGKDKDK